MSTRSRRKAPGRFKYSMVPYGATVYLVTSMELWERYVKVTPEDHVDGLSSQVANGDRYIGVFNQNLGVLVHECMHAVMDTLDDRGIKANDAGGEVACYHVQDMFEFFKEHI